MLHCRIIFYQAGYGSIFDPSPTNRPYAREHVEILNLPLFPIFIFFLYLLHSRLNVVARERNITGALDKPAFEELFRSFFPGLVLFAQKYLPDQDTAKEIVHNVFINLWEKRGNVDAGSSLKSYLFTSVHNRCLNHIRDQKKFDKDETHLQRLDSTDFADGKDRLEEQELEDRMYDALQALPEKCREVFTLSRFEGLKYVEIAEQLGISVKTVEAQISKALRILREKLIDYLTILILFMINHLN